MIALSIKAAQGGFFDRPKVVAAVDKETRAALSKFGAFVRRRAQTSIRPRKAVSRVGSPPSSHEGSLRKLIYFSFNAPTKSVVIGPALLNGAPAAGKTVPGLLEFGGERGEAVYRPRPFMGPAFAAELKAAPELWKNSIKGG